MLYLRDKTLNRYDRMLSIKMHHLRLCQNILTLCSVVVPVPEDVANCATNSLLRSAMLSEDIVGYIHTSNLALLDLNALLQAAVFGLLAFIIQRRCRG